MLKQYFKQALQMLKENPLVNTISILGTALSIAMILVIVLVFQINNANYAPESHRDRMLYVQMTQAFCEERGQRNNGNMSGEVLKECFYTLQLPEAVSGLTFSDKPVSLPGKRLFDEYKIIYTDAGFWKIFDFRFLKGSPFSETDFLSGIPRAVVSEKVARKLFGTIEVIGETIQFDYMDYTICGVVKTVSVAARSAFSDIWVPYTSKPGISDFNASYEGISGPFQTVILARKKSDREAIKAELESQTARYNTMKQECKVSFPNNPFTQLDLAMGSGGIGKVSVKDYLLSTGSTILFLLLIPAINLTGIVQSSVQRRRSEMGLRKAFGARKSTLMNQVLFENLVITSIGGIIGLGLSFIFIYLSRSFMLSEGMTLTAEMLFKPGLFLAVLVFAFLLNLFSAGLPALSITRQQIAESLKDNNS